LSEAKIVETLLHGVMRPMATGLSKQDVRNVAGFLTSGK